MKNGPAKATCLTAILTGAAAALTGWLAAGSWRQDAPADGGVREKVAAVMVKAPPSAAALATLRRFAENDPPAGADLKTVLGMASGHSPLDAALEECLLRELVERNPRTALDSALRGVEGHTAEELAKRILTHWLRFDFDAAVSAMSSLPSSMKQNLERPLSEEMGRVNPRRALEMLQSGKLTWITGTFENRNLQKAVVAELGHLRPEEALAMAVEMRDEHQAGEYRSMVQPVLSEWVRRDPAAVKRWLSEHGSEGGGMAGLAAAAALFAGDPAERVEVLKEALVIRTKLTPESWDDPNEWLQLARNLRGADPEAAMAHARTLPENDPLRRAVLESAAVEAAERPVTPESLALLAEAAAANPMDPDKRYVHEPLERAIRRSMEELAAADPQAALQQARAFPDAPRAMAAVAGWLMQNRSDEAPAMLREVLSSPETTVVMSKILGSESGDYDQSIDYSKILTQVPEARALINGTMLSAWVVANPVAASRFYAEELQAGRNPAGGQNMLVQWMLNDSAAAAAWVETLPAGDFRKAAETNIVATWMRADPEAAKAWKERVVKPEK